MACWRKSTTSCGNRTGRARRCGCAGRWLGRLAFGGAIGAAVWFVSARAAGLRGEAAAHADEATPEILPGDELVPHADIVATRSIEIAALPEEVWPWLAQMGQDKAGFYSWTALENLAGIGMPEVHRIVPAWQDLRAGDPVTFGEGLAAVAAIVEPPHVLVLHGDPQALAAGEALAPDRAADAAAPRTAEVGEGDPGFAFTWAFVIEPTATGSRLIARERFAWLNTRGRIGATIGALLSRPMSARMMSTIKRLAEQG